MSSNSRRRRDGQAGLGGVVPTVIGVSDARNCFTALVDHVESNGGEVVITRRGRPVAKLVSADRLDQAHARETARKLRAASKGKTLGGISLGNLIEKGRR